MCVHVADSLGPMCLYANKEGLGQILAKKEVCNVYGGLGGGGGGGGGIKGIHLILCTCIHVSSVLPLGLYE